MTSFFSWVGGLALGFVLLTASGCGDARPTATSDSGARDSGNADASQPDADAMGGETGDVADAGAAVDGEVSNSCVGVTGGGPEPWLDLQIAGSQFDAYEGRRIRIVVSNTVGGRLGVAEATIASGAFELAIPGTLDYGVYPEIALYIDDDANSACDVGEPLWVLRDGHRPGEPPGRRDSGGAMPQRRGAQHVSRLRFMANSDWPVRHQRTTGSAHASVVPPLNFARGFPCESAYRPSRAAAKAGSA